MTIVRGRKELLRRLHERPPPGSFKAKKIFNPSHEHAKKIVREAEKQFRKEKRDDPS